ncbi:hypothetical protein DFH07DRAFT_781817 [Mycena maculata]|uniref:Uncharacterized protein n=1 Tax=Mycena maculata TaxID=230809 RepID=A0AAD7HXH3_9AGAR|nr:hypothetical protein DFH07DRAFT_781817 [Mycena maculata]
MGATWMNIHNQMEHAGRSMAQWEWMDITDEELHEATTEISIKHPFSGSTIILGHLEAMGISRKQVQLSLRRVDEIGPKESGTWGKIRYNIRKEDIRESETHGQGKPGDELTKAKTLGYFEPRSVPTRASRPSKETKKTLGASHMHIHTGPTPRVSDVKQSTKRKIKRGKKERTANALSARARSRLKPRSDLWSSKTGMPHRKQDESLREKWKRKEYVRVNLQVKALVFALDASGTRTKIEKKKTRSTPPSESTEECSEMVDADERSPSPDLIDGAGEEEVDDLVGGGGWGWAPFEFGVAVEARVEWTPPCPLRGRSSSRFRLRGLRDSAWTQGWKSRATYRESVDFECAAERPLKISA